MTHQAYNQTEKLAHMNMILEAQCSLLRLNKVLYGIWFTEMVIFLVGAVVSVISVLYFWSFISAVILIPLAIVLLYWTFGNFYRWLYEKTKIGEIERSIEDSKKSIRELIAR